LLSAFLAFGRDIKVGFSAVITREDVKTIKDFLDYIAVPLTSDGPYYYLL